MEEEEDLTDGFLLFPERVVQYMLEAPAVVKSEQDASFVEESSEAFVMM
jgi:hypothetical protein